ncbi:MAG: hypothetical protein K0S38_660 [Candidatus Paceibacter sp.]|jgi:hypothetical protein|nr:hypothetical protein [Candidatus Paceibacter sp.]
MLEKLKEMFVDRRVEISHSNDRLKTETGVCKNIHETPGEPGHYDLELTDGSRYGFSPVVVSADGVDGPLNAFAGGRRMIRAISEKFINSDITMTLTVNGETHTRVIDTDHTVLLELNRAIRNGKDPIEALLFLAHVGTQNSRLWGVAGKNAIGE